MAFTGGYKNHFISTARYNYFSGNGFNLGKDIYAAPAKPSEKDFCHPKFQNNITSHCLENEGRRRSSSCPLPMHKKRFDHDSPPPSPGVDALFDSKLDHTAFDVLPEETLHILVTGPPRCGKYLLVQAIVKRRVKIAANTGPSLAFNQGFTMLGVKVNANVWYMKNPKDCTVSLKDAFCDKNFCIILVYDVTVPKTLFDVREYILAFKRVFGANVPIILVGNKTSMRTLIMNELSMLDWGLLAFCDGQQVKDEYKLAGFVECSGETGYGTNELLFKASMAALGDCFKF